MDELKEILAKDGKAWTREEAEKVKKAIRDHGRQVLKDIRRELRA